jgi:dipeptidyl aminopeptidase/acylaminoacyl peptidase
MTALKDGVLRLRQMMSVGLLLLGMHGATCAQGTAAAPPVEAFFSPAKLQDAEISPSGRWMAALTGVPGRRVGLMMFDLDGKEPSKFIEASPKDNVSWFTWVNDDWLVFGVHSPLDRGVGQRAGGLIALRRDGSASRLLITREYEPEDPFQRRRYLNPDHFFYRVGPEGSTEVIVGQAQWDVRDEFSHVDLRALNVATSGVRTLLDDAPRADTWMFDGKGRARIARYTKEGVTTTWWADTAGRWRQISKAPTYEQPFIPRYVDGDDDLVVSTVDAKGSLELRRFDFAAGKPMAETLLATPGFNSGLRVRTQRDTGRVTGLDVTTDAVSTVWFDQRAKALQDKVDAKFPNTINQLLCRPCDGTRPVIVYAYSDRDPGNFVLWRPQEDKWQLLGEAMANIPADRMAPLEFHRTQARDGGDLPVWVTRPQAQHLPGAKPAPAVVLVHGGPFSRGVVWGWRAQSQFLASRGYVVIEPEFRGSRGYGENHHRAGWKQWGRAMQDDVADALKFAVKQGWVDASRVCIMGSSYGGYSTLMGLIRDPDLYRCGVAFAAVSDLRYLYDFHWADESDEGRRYDLPIVLGDKVKDAAILAAGSAVDQAAKIKVPLLLSHGGRDRRVPIEHAEAMLAALRKAGKDVEWVRYAEEGHGFSFDENRFDFYRRVETFLAKHLK